MNALEEYQQLSQSKIPILLIWGEEDQSVTYEAINEARLVLPHAEYLQLTQAGHLPHFEKAEDGQFYSGAVFRQYGVIFQP